MTIGIRAWRLVLALTLFGAVVTIGQASPPAASAEEPSLPGMCHGRTDPNVEVSAQANGPGDAIKYILLAETDELGKPRGHLILEQGPDRLVVTEWCRLWQHQPGQPPGPHCESDGTEANINLHMVGLAALGDGTRVLFRTDLRVNEEGASFRVRYRAMGGHHEEATAAAAEGEDDGCEDESWVRLPAHGWRHLTHARVRSAHGQSRGPHGGQVAPAPQETEGFVIDVPVNEPDDRPGNGRGHGPVDAPGHESGDAPGHGQGDAPGQGTGEAPGRGFDDVPGNGRGNPSSDVPGSDPDERPGVGSGHGRGDGPE